MKGYGSVFQARFRLLLQYRAAATAGFATQLFWGLIRVMIFDAFYRQGGGEQPLSFPEVVTYVWLGQATLALTLGGAEAEIRAMVRCGTVAYELVRPLDLYGFWYCRTLAGRVAPMLLRGVPLYLAALLFFGLGPPAGPEAALGFAASLAAAVLLAGAVFMLMNVSLFWTVSGEGVARFGPALIYVCSGLLVPLPLFPEWARAALGFLPFRGLADVPYRIYLGHLPAEAVPGLLLHQLAWTAALVLFGRYLLARAARRLVVQGG
ncbi:MAG: ABC transporter permease [Armatimonadota bacterium]